MTLVPPALPTRRRIIPTAARGIPGPGAPPAPAFPVAPAGAAPRVPAGARVPLHPDDLAPKDEKSAQMRAFLENLAHQHTQPEQREGAPLRFVRGVADFLSRGQYASANVALALRRGDYDVWHPFLNGLVGKEKGDYKEVFKSMGMHDAAGKIDPVDVLGLAANIFLDPTTYLGFGSLTKLGEAARGASELEKSVKLGGAAGEAALEAQKSGKLARELQSFARQGRNTEWGRNLAEQFSRGQRKLIGWEVPRFKKLGGEGVLRNLPVPELIVPRIRALGIPVGAAAGFMAGGLPGAAVGAVAGGLAGRVPGLRELPILPPFPAMQSVAHLPIPAAIEGGIVGALSKAALYAREEMPFTSQFAQALGKMFNTYFRPAGMDPQVWSELSDEIRAFKSGVIGGKGEVMARVKELGMREGPLAHVLGHLEDPKELNLVVKAIESPEKLSVADRSIVNEVLERGIKTYDPTQFAIAAARDPARYDEAIARMTAREQALSQAIDLQRSGQVEATDLALLEAQLKETRQALDDLRGGGGPPSGGGGAPPGPAGSSGVAPASPAPPSPPPVSENLATPPAGPAAQASRPSPAPTPPAEVAPSGARRPVLELPAPPAGLKLSPDEQEALDTYTQVHAQTVADEERVRSMIPLAKTPADAKALKDAARAALARRAAAVTRIRGIHAAAGERAAAEAAAAEQAKVAAETQKAVDEAANQATAEAQKAVDARVKEALASPEAKLLMADVNTAHRDQIEKLTRERQWHLDKGPGHPFAVQKAAAMQPKIDQLSAQTVGDYAQTRFGGDPQKIVDYIEGVKRDQHLTAAYQEARALEEQKQAAQVARTESAMPAEHPLIEKLREHLEPGDVQNALEAARMGDREEFLWYAEDAFPVKATADALYDDIRAGMKERPTSDEAVRYATGRSEQELVGEVRDVAEQNIQRMRDMDPMLQADIVGVHVVGPHRAGIAPGKATDLAGRIHGDAHNPPQVLVVLNSDLPPSDMESLARYEHDAADVIYHQLRKGETQEQVVRAFSPEGTSAPPAPKDQLDLYPTARAAEHPVKLEMAESPEMAHIRNADDEELQALTHSTYEEINARRAAADQVEQKLAENPGLSPKFVKQAQAEIAQNREIADSMEEQLNAQLGAIGRRPNPTPLHPLPPPAAVRPEIENRLAAVRQMMQEREELGAVKGAEAQHLQRSEAIAKELDDIAGQMTPETSPIQKGALEELRYRFVHSEPHSTAVGATTGAPDEIAKEISGTPQKLKRSKTAAKSPIKANGDPVVSEAIETDKAKALRMANRDNYKEILNGTRDEMKRAVLWSPTGEAKQIDVFDALRLATTNPAGEAPRVIKEGILSPVFHTVEYFPEVRVLELHATNGQTLQFHYDASKVMSDEAKAARAEKGTWDGAASKAEAIAAWKQKHGKLPLMTSAAENWERNGVVGAQVKKFIAEHPLLNEYTAGGRKVAKPVKLKLDEVFGRYETAGETLHGTNRPPRMGPGTVVEIDGKPGVVESYGGAGGPYEGKRTSKVRAVHMEDGTVMHWHVDDLEIADAKSVVANHESLIKYLKRKFQSEDGSINLDLLMPFMGRAMKDPSLRRQFATEITDDLIRLNPRMLSKRQEVIRWLDAMSEAEQARGLLPGFIDFYFPHQKERAPAWQWLFGRGKVVNQKESWMLTRGLEGTIDEINMRSMAFGNGKIFNEDLLAGLAVRGVASDRAIRTFDFIEHMGDRWGVALKDMTGDHFESVTALMAKMGRPAADIERAVALNKRLIELGGSTVSKVLESGEAVLKGRLPKETPMEVVKIRKELADLMPDVGLYVPRGGFSRFPRGNFSEAVAKGELTADEAQSALAVLTDLKIKEGEHLIAVPMHKLRDLVALGRHVNGYMMPLEVANALNGTINNYVRMGEDIHPFVKLFDGLQKPWKAWTLSVWPVYHTRNMVGNVWNAWLGGLHDVNRYSDAFDFQTGQLKSFTDYFGKSWSPEQMEKVMVELGVVNRGFYASELTQALEAELKPWYPQGIGEVKDPHALMSLLFGDRNAMLRMGKRMGETIENNARIAMFMDGLKKGLPADRAAAKMKLHLFDYSDLTTLERNLFRRAFPFYAWTRFNMPLQLRYLITRPGKFLGVLKTAHALEAGVPAPPDESLMPSWMQDQLPVRVRQNEDGSYSYFLLGGWLPSGDLGKLFDVPSLATDMLTPIAKAPIEYGLNYSLFFHDQIEKYPHETGEFFGTRMRKRDIYMLRNVRALNTFDRLLYDKNLPEAQRWTNLFFGRYYPVNYQAQKEQHLYQLKRDEQDTRRALKIETRKAQDDLKTGVRQMPGGGAVQVLKDRLAYLRSEQKRLEHLHTPGPTRLQRKQRAMGGRTLTPEREQQIRAIARRRVPSGISGQRPRLPGQ